MNKKQLKFQYDVVLSFAGEDRDYVEQVAKALDDLNVKVFYDDFKKSELWGKDLFSYLDDVYKNRAKYCVMFISVHYAKKLWTDHERKSAQERAFKQNEEYILPARFDNSEIPGIRSTVGYIDLNNYSPQQFSALIMEKLGRRNYQLEHQEIFRKPKINNNKSINPYEESQRFINFIQNKLKERASVLSSEGLSLSCFERNSKNCFRFVVDGEAKYSLNIWMGSIGGDSGISFYGGRGEISSFSSNSSNAWGNIEWDSSINDVVLNFQDLSLLNAFSSASQKKYKKEEFMEELWNSICDILEET